MGPPFSIDEGVPRRLRVISKHNIWIPTRRRKGTLVVLYLFTFRTPYLGLQCDGHFPRSAYTEDSLLEDYIHIDTQRVLSNLPFKWIETTFGIKSSVNCGGISFFKLDYFSMYSKMGIVRFTYLLKGNPLVFPTG